VVPRAHFSWVYHDILESIKVSGRRGREEEEEERGRVVFAEETEEVPTAEEEEEEEEEEITDPYNGSIPSILSQGRAPWGQQNLRPVTPIETNSPTTPDPRVEALRSMAQIIVDLQDGVYEYDNDVASVLEDDIMTYLSLPELPKSGLKVNIERILMLTYRPYKTFASNLTQYGGQLFYLACIVADVDLDLFKNIHGSNYSNIRLAAERFLDPAFSSVYYFFQGNKLFDEVARFQTGTQSPEDKQFVDYDVRNYFQALTKENLTNIDLESIWRAYVGVYEYFDQAYVLEDMRSTIERLRMSNPSSTTQKNAYNPPYKKSVAYYKELIEGPPLLNP
jgi:hypothetical protein